MKKRIVICDGEECSAQEDIGDRYADGWMAIEVKPQASKQHFKDFCPKCAPSMFKLIIGEELPLD